MTGPFNKDEAAGTASGSRSLRELRAERLLTIRELARQAGVAATTIHAIETGARPPGRRIIRRVAAALKVEPGDVAEFRSRLPFQTVSAEPQDVAARLEAMGYPRVLAQRAANQGT